VAHRRALARHWGRTPWLLASAALVLDGAAALAFAGLRQPFGLKIPAALLVAAPVLAYAAIAAVALRTRPIAVRVGAAATLLGLHAALVAGHALIFAMLWSLPVPAALRLAHRWSPLIPLLQLLWVPLLALPLSRLTRAPAPASARRSGPPPPRRDVLAARGAPTGQRGRSGPDRDLAAERGGHGIAPVATADTMPAALEPMVAPAIVPPATPPIVPAVPAPVVSTASTVEAPVQTLPVPAVPEPEPSAPAAAPLVVHDLDGAVLAVLASVAPGPADATPDEVQSGAGIVEVEDEPAETPAAAPAHFHDHAASIDTVVVLVGDTSPPESARVLDAAPVIASLALPPAPSPAPPPAPPPTPRPTPQIATPDPPLNLYIVARLFEPYGSLLSRDGTVLVDWVPHPDSAVVCAAARDVSRERLVRLGGRLARALTGAGASSTSIPVRRLSLRSSDGVAVLTPLDGGILVAAARRPGAAALLEVLSARVVPGPLGVEASAAESGDGLAAEIRVTDAVRVETSAATLDVLAPTAADAESLGELAGRLLQAIAEDDDDRMPVTLSVDLEARRLMVHPVLPSGRPPRFVAVVGTGEAPGLLWRRAKRAARALRAAS
jgi:hypothetical protein